VQASVGSTPWETGLDVNAVALALAQASPPKAIESSPDTAEAAAEQLRRQQQGGGEPEPQDPMLQMLTDMGFPPPRARYALRVTGEKGVQEAMNWLLEHAGAHHPPESSRHRQSPHPEPRRR